MEEDETPANSGISLSPEKPDKIEAFDSTLGQHMRANHLDTIAISDIDRLVFWVPNYLLIIDLLVNLLRKIPVSVGVSLYEAISLYKGRRIISSKGEATTHWKVHQLVLYCACGILAGMVRGLPGLGGGFISGPLFLELGVPPQVDFCGQILRKLSVSLPDVTFYKIDIDEFNLVQLNLPNFSNKKKVGISQESGLRMHR